MAIFNLKCTTSSSCHRNSTSFHELWTNLLNATFVSVKIRLAKAGVIKFCFWKLRNIKIIFWTKNKILLIFSEENNLSTIKNCSYTSRRHCRNAFSLYSVAFSRWIYYKLTDNGSRHQYCYYKRYSFAHVIVGYSIGLLLSEIWNAKDFRTFMSWLM